MATISNTPRPGYVWDATDNCWYPIGTGPHTHAYIPESIVDAKGDLISATADNTPARLAVGNNGETLVADSSASTGLRWQGSTAAGRNFLINGNFDIFQRGSFASQTVSGYSLDRWNAGVGGTVTISQQSSGAPIGSQFYMRTAYNGGGGNFANQHNTLESSMVQILVGQTVTFSVLVRANASYVATSGQGLQIAIDKNATANTATGGSWSTVVSTNVMAASIPTGTGSSNWLKVSVTAAIPNDGTANGLRVRVGELVTGPSGAYWEMAQAQLEIGSVATSFTRAGGNIAGELAACQRYYWRQNGFGGANNAFAFTGLASASNQFYVTIYPPTEFRVSPTSIDFSNLGVYIFRTGGNLAATPSLNAAMPKGVGLVFTVSGGLTINDGGIINQQSAGTAFLGLSAEL